jgi:hypothetical protein
LVTEVDEIQHTIKHLQGVLDDLCVRGLRSAGARELNLLQTLQTEFERIEAHHLASRVARLREELAAGNRTAAAALLKTQASLRVFERILTLDVAQAALAGLLASDSE